MREKNKNKFAWDIYFVWFFKIRKCWAFTIFTKSSLSSIKARLEQAPFLPIITQPGPIL